MAFKMKKATIYKLVDDNNKKKTLGDVKKEVSIGVVDGLKSIAKKTYGAAKRGYKAAKTLKK